MQYVTKHESQVLKQMCDVCFWFWLVFVGLFFLFGCFFFSIAALPNQKIQEMIYI